MWRNAPGEEAHGAGNGEISGEVLWKQLQDSERRNRALQGQLELYMSEAFLAQSALSECAQHIEIISAAEEERNRQSARDQLARHDPSAVAQTGVGPGVSPPNPPNHASDNEVDEAMALAEALVASEMALDAALAEHDRLSQALGQAQHELRDLRRAPEQERHAELRSELTRVRDETRNLMQQNEALNAELAEMRCRCEESSSLPLHAENSRSRGCNGGLDTGADAQTVEMLHQELRRCRAQAHDADERSYRAVAEVQELRNELAAKQAAIDGLFEERFSSLAEQTRQAAEHAEYRTLNREARQFESSDDEEFSG